MLALIFGALYLAKTVSFSISIIILFSLVFTLGLRKLNSALASAFTRRLNPYIFSYILARFRAQHTSICRVLLHFNQHFVSPFYFTMILGNLPINAFGVMFIIYEPSLSS